MIPTTRSEAYLTEYMTNPTAIDAYYMGIKYKDLHVVSDDLQDIDSIVGVAFLVNDYKWAKLYATLDLEYNPIWNVDGKVEETHDIDKRHTEDNFAERENTDNYGASGGSTTYGLTNDNTTNKTTPYDDSTFRNLSKQEHEILEHEDEYTTNQHEDTHTYGAHIDEHDEDAYKDVITTIRTGNIGMTSTQELIGRERDISDFKFLDILMRDIINMITEPYFEEV